MKNLLKIKKKLHTFKDLNWRWACKYYKKRFFMQFFYDISRVRKRKYWNVDIDGVNIKLGFSHPYHHLIARQMHFGKHEQNILAIWKRVAEESTGTIIDCGGYNGIFGLVASKVNPDAKIIIVEPNSTNCKHIQNNIYINNLNNIEIVQGVISDLVGVVKFQSDDGHSGGFIADTGEDVKSVTLDSYKNVSLIKIDVEGAEYRTLLGGTRLLEDGVNILLELHKNYLQRFHSTESDIWNLLRKYGYKNLFLNTSTISEEHYWIYS